MFYIMETKSFTWVISPLGAAPYFDISKTPSWALAEEETSNNNKANEIVFNCKSISLFYAISPQILKEIYINDEILVSITIGCL